MLKKKLIEEIIKDYRKRLSSNKVGNTEHIIICAKIEALEMVLDKKGKK